MRRIVVASIPQAGATRSGVNSRELSHLVEAVHMGRDRAEVDEAVGEQDVHEREQE